MLHDEQNRLIALWVCVGGSGNSRPMFEMATDTPSPTHRHTPSSPMTSSLLAVGDEHHPLLLRRSPTPAAAVKSLLASTRSGDSLDTHEQGQGLGSDAGGQGGGGGGGERGSVDIELGTRTLFCQMDILCHFNDGSTGWKESAR